MKGTLSIASTVVISTLPGIVFASTVFVDVPTTCSSVEKIDGDKIYILSHKPSCGETIGKIEVTIPDKITQAEIYVDGTLWRKQQLSNNGYRTDEIMQRAAKQAAEMKISENINAERGREEARQLDSYFKSASFQTKIQEEAGRLKEELFKPQADAVKSYYSDVQAKKTERLSQNERIYVFISSSLPMSTLRNYIRTIDQLQEENVILVMRGGVNGLSKIAPTLEFSSKVLNRDPSCNPAESHCAMLSAQIIIDPLLFRRYGIKKVPAFVYAKKVEVGDGMGSEGIEEDVKVGDSYTVYGDVSLEYALEIISKERGNEKIKTLVSALEEKGFYHNNQ